MATGGRMENPNTCAVCLCSFRNPKFLPCHHSFCATCIEDLADQHPGGYFPCPYCRAVTCLPPGGVASLQMNFYIQQQPRDLCPIHEGKKLDIYCVTCDEALCSDCREADHGHHQTEDLTSAAARKQKELQKDRQRLRRAVSDVKKNVTSLKEKRQSVDKQRAAVEKDIQNRYSAFVAEATKVRDEQLSSLSSLHADIDTDVVHALEEQKSHKTELSNLLQQVDDAIFSGSASDVIIVAKEMTSGRGSQQAVDAVTSGEERPLQSLILHFNKNTDVTLKSMRFYLHLFLGVVRKKDMREETPEMKITERFQCGEDPELEVFALCHVDCDPPRVWVSYERCVMQDAPVNVFSEAGERLGTYTEHSGKMSYIRCAEGLSIGAPDLSNQFSTYCKSFTSGIFSLDNKLSGQAVIFRHIVTSIDPIDTKYTAEFMIQVGPHQAFDVDNTEQNFAVVEEANESSARRSVHLFRRPVAKAISTYTPPVAAYQPSDVCFYTLGGQEVLLITDEANDTIHVVSFRGEAMQFERYLCPGAPSLNQPTAITVDVHGRLWVACRGGIILTIEQFT